MFNAANFSSTFGTDHFSSGWTLDEVICLVLVAIYYKKYISLNIFTSYVKNMFL